MGFQRYECHRPVVGMARSCFELDPDRDSNLLWRGVLCLLPGWRDVTSAFARTSAVL